MKNYNLHLIKSRRSYNIKEIAFLLCIDRKTCQRWIKIDGLKTIDRCESPLVMGDVLKEFLDEKSKKREVNLSENEFYCMKCHKAVKAKINSEKIVKTGKRIGKNGLEQFLRIGFCEVCNTKVNKFLRVSNQD